MLLFTGKCGSVETLAEPPHLTLTHALLRKALGDTPAIALSLPKVTGRKTPGETLGNIARGGKGLALKHVIIVVIITFFFFLKSFPLISAP